MTLNIKAIAAYETPSHTLASVCEATVIASNWLLLPSPLYRWGNWSRARQANFPSEVSRVRLFATPWTVTYQAPPSMGFSRQEYWSGVPFPFPRASVKFRSWTQAAYCYGYSTQRRAKFKVIFCQIPAKFLGHVTLWVSIFSYVQWRSEHLTHRVLVRIKWNTYAKNLAQHPVQSKGFSN